MPEIPAKISEEVYVAAGRAYCLARYSYRPEVYVSDEARERHIDRDAAEEALQPSIRTAVEVAYRAGLEDAAREMAQKIIDHADRYAPLDGNIQQRRMRRHLMIAVQVVSPKPSLEEIAAAVARGDYVACHLDEYGQPVDHQPSEDQDTPEGRT